MKTGRISLALGVGVAAGCVALAPVGAQTFDRHHSDASRSMTAWPTFSSADSAVATTDGVVAAAIADEPCALEAVPTLPDTVDSRIADEKPDPASQVGSPESALDRSDAINAARALAAPVEQAQEAEEPAPDTAAYPAAVAQVPYRLGNQFTGGSSNDQSVVAPSRCVWAVTVHAPYQPGSVPVGIKPTTFDRYTVIYDVASGEYLGLAAGAYGTDLITGRAPS